MWQISWKVFSVFLPFEFVTKSLKFYMNQATPPLALVVFGDYVSTSQPGFLPIILVLSLSLVSLSLGWQIGNLCMWA